MISFGFINGESEALLATDEYVEFENTLSKIEDCLKEAYDEYFVYEKAYEAELFVMEEVSKETSDKKEETKLNVVEKIGKAIAEIVKAFIRFLERMGERIKNLGFENKSDYEKLQKLANSNTEYKSQIIDAIKAGDLDISSAKNIKEVESLYYEFLAEAKSKDPSSAFEKFKYKMKNIDKSTGVKVVAAVAGAVTLGNGLFKLQQNVSQLKHNQAKYKSDAIEMANKTADLKKKLLDMRSNTSAKTHNENISEVDKALSMAMSAIAKYNSDDVAKTERVKKAILAFSKVGDGIKEAGAKISNAAAKKNTSAQQYAGK